MVHLGAQAGVRYSIDAPHAYVQSNVVGTLNVLEGCRHEGVEHLVYASTSSVYGANTNMPFSEHHIADHPLSLYAASKRSTELMAHNYSSLFKLPTTGLRFFTVYGPWGRPDMALFLFTRNILDGKPIDVFNFGHHKRDFTYVEDIVEGVVRVVDRIAQPNPAWNSQNPDPASEPCAVSALQHRQQLTGGAAALHRGHRAVPGKEGAEESAAAAAGRCARYFRRHRRFGPGYRLPPGYADRDGACGASSNGTATIISAGSERPWSRHAAETHTTRSSDAGTAA